MRFRRQTIFYLIVLILSCVAILFYQTYLHRQIRIEGDSMFPSIKDGDRIYINTFKHHFKPIERNSVIVFEIDEKIYCKRVIGLPGETLSIKDCNFYINDTLIETVCDKNGYLDVMKLMVDNGRTDPMDIEPLHILSSENGGENHYFVIGDYIISSIDSRHFGTIPESCIIGTSTNY